jgi:pimeloyl-ACP methyl ester carboxylesterase
MNPFPEQKEKIMAEYRSLWFESDDGLRLHVRDQGPEDAPLAVLCMHGLTRNGADFEALAARLDDRYRVLAPDVRGRGRSDRDPQPANYDVARYVRDTLGIVDELGLDRPLLAGTSMGGLMAMLMVAERPDAFRGLVLNDIGPVLEPAGLERIQGYVGTVEPLATWEDAARAVQAVNGIAFPHYGFDDWLAFARRTWRERDDGRVEPDYDPAISEAVKAGSGAAVPPDLWPVFEALRSLPLLVVRGGISDLLSAETVATMRERKPDMEAVEAAGIGHAPMLDEADVVPALDAFIDAVAGR